MPTLRFNLRMIEKPPMTRQTLFFRCLGLLLLAMGLIGRVPVAYAQTSASSPVVVVATPNPNVFPLLLAMARNPNLPVKLVAVADGAGIDTAFATQNADAVLAMTSTIAAKVASGKVPPLRLTDATLWRGFTVMVMGDVPAPALADLKGRGFIISGPTSGGQGGGPDLLFQAAMKRSGLAADDLKICYLPVKTGVDWLMNRKPLGDHANCEPDKDVPAAGMLLVEPAVSGLTLMSRLPWKPRVDARIPIEPIFSGFKAWPANQLPHGGLAVRVATLDDTSRAAAVLQVRQAYAAAIDEINAAHGSAIARYRLARVVSSGFKEHFGSFGLDLPALALANSLSEQALLYRRDLAVPALAGDLEKFLTEVVGRSLPASFYR